MKNEILQAIAATTLSFEIGKIGLSGKTALPIAAKDSLKTVCAIGANRYLEAINEAYLAITTIDDPINHTIYDIRAGDGMLPAVQARHFGLRQTEAQSHNHDTCKAKRLSPYPV